ncbi:MAG: hypothetical protein PHT33_06895 [bacterium]|nr:hypothetical protein [bacterium]
MSDNNENRIRIGDMVKVRFGLDSDMDMVGIVEYMPCATGDCWIIRDFDGMIFYVQTFAFILRYPRREEVQP